MSTSEERAKVVYESLHYHLVDTPIAATDIGKIARALQAERAAVWEEAAKVVENRVLNSSQSDRIPIFPLLDYFLDKAKEAQP